MTFTSKGDQLASLNVSTRGWKLDIYRYVPATLKPYPLRITVFPSASAKSDRLDSLVVDLPLLERTGPSSVGDKCYELELVLIDGKVEKRSVTPTDISRCFQ